jgi:hypothetical protein
LAGGGGGWGGGGGGGGGVLNCVVDHKFYTLFLIRLRTYKIALPPKKMTSKDDI